MARTMSKDPMQQYRFKVQVGNASAVFDTTIGFMKVDGLETEVDVIEYREGGSSTTYKLPGIEKTGTLTLERGVFKNVEMYNWFTKVTTSADFRYNVIITEQDRFGASFRQWTLSEAWVSKISAPSLDASSAEVSVETCEIQFESLAVQTV